MNETYKYRFFKDCGFIDGFFNDSTPVERITKLEIKNENMTISVNLTDSEVKETVSKLLANFSPDEVIDILADIIHEKKQNG